MFNKIPIRLYYDNEGHLFTYGNLNKIPLLNKLSNYAYELTIVCPFNNDNNLMYYNYERADGTQNATPIPMVYVGTESVKVLKTINGVQSEVIEEWSVYNAQVEDNVLKISTPNHQNWLKIGFTLTYYQLSGYDTEELTPIMVNNTLNFTPTTFVCNYALGSNQSAVEDTPLEIILAYINHIQEILDNKKIDKVSGIQIASNLPDYSSADKYKLYIMKANGTKGTLTYKKGDIILTGDSAYELISYGKSEIDTQYNALNTLIEQLDLEKLDKIDGITIIWNNETTIPTTKGTYLYLGDEEYEDNRGVIKQYDLVYYDSDIEEETFQHIANLGDINECVEDIGELQGQVEDIETDITEIKGDIQTIEDDISAINNEIESLDTRITTNANDIDSLENSVQTLGNSIDIVNDKVEQVENNALFKDYRNLTQANELADTDLVIIRSGNTTYKIPFSVIRQAIEPETVNHYKGDFLSLEALESAYPIGKPGDYAFVNVNDTLTMYVWDDDDEEWKEVGGDQFVKSITFDTYKTDIQSGANVVGKAKDYDNTSGSIKTRFESVDSDIETLESQKEDTEAHKVQDFFETYETQELLSEYTHKNLISGTTIIDQNAIDFLGTIKTNYNAHNNVAPYSLTKTCIVLEDTIDINTTTPELSSGLLKVFVVSDGSILTYEINISDGIVLDDEEPPKMVSLVRTYTEKLGEHPITKVNNKTGNIVLSASDINASDNATIQAHLTEIESDISDIESDVSDLETTKQNQLSYTQEGGDLTSLTIDGTTLGIKATDTNITRITSDVPTNETEYNKNLIYHNKNSGETYFLKEGTQTTPYLETSGLTYTTAYSRDYAIYNGKIYHLDLANSQVQITDMATNTTTTQSITKPQTWLTTANFISCSDNEGNIYYVCVNDTYYGIYQFDCTTLSFTLLNNFRRISNYNIESCHFVFKKDNYLYICDFDYDYSHFYDANFYSFNLNTPSTAPTKIMYSKINSTSYTGSISCRLLDNYIIVKTSKDGTEPNSAGYLNLTTNIYTTNEAYRNLALGATFELNNSFYRAFTSSGYLRVYKTNSITSPSWSLVKEIEMSLAGLDATVYNNKAYIFGLPTNIYNYYETLSYEKQNIPTEQNVALLDKANYSTNELLFNAVKNAYTSGKFIVLKDGTSFYNLDRYNNDSSGESFYFNFYHFSSSHTTSSYIGINAKQKKLSLSSGSYSYSDIITGLNTVECVSLTLGSQIGTQYLNYPNPQSVIYVYDNEYYYFADKRSDHYVYSHVGMDNQQQTFIKNLYIYTDSSSALYRTWTITTTEIQSKLSVNQSSPTGTLTSLTINGTNYAISGGSSGGVSSVNGETGDVVLTADDILVDNSQSIQANLERIDTEIEGIIDDYATQTYVDTAIQNAIASTLQEDF